METESGERKRKLPSYIQARDPSIDRRFRPCPTRQVNLDRVIQESCELNGLMEDCDIEEQTPENTVSVFLRLRPHSQTDTNKYKVQDNDLVVYCEETTNHFKKEISEKHFSFSKIFSDSVSQHEMYEICVRSHLNDVTTDVGSTFLT